MKHRLAGNGFCLRCGATRTRKFYWGQTVATVSGDFYGYGSDPRGPYSWHRGDDCWDHDPGCIEVAPLAGPEPRPPRPRRMSPQVRYRRPARTVKIVRLQGRG